MLRGNHRGKRRGKRLVLSLAIIVCVTAVVDFGLNAYQKTNFCTSSYRDPLTGQLVSGSCTYDDQEEATVTETVDLHMRLDAAAALLTSLVILGTSVKLAKIPRRRKRLVLGTEAVVVTFLVVAGLQLTLWEAGRWHLARVSGNHRMRAERTSYETTPHAEWPPEMTIAGDRPFHK